MFPGVAAPENMGLLEWLFPLGAEESRHALATLPVISRLINEMFQDLCQGGVVVCYGPNTCQEMHCNIVCVLNWRPYLSPDQLSVCELAEFSLPDVCSMYHTINIAML